MATARESAGTLLYRRLGETLEVLIVEPSGPAARWGWSIPKGLPDPGESLELAARRETKEETGCIPDDLAYLGYIDYAQQKTRSLLLWTCSESSSSREFMGSCGSSFHVDG